jgi:hypothetical protein
MWQFRNGLLSRSFGGPKRRRSAHGTDSRLTVISFAGFRGGNSYSNSLIFCVF